MKVVYTWVSTIHYDIKDKIVVDFMIDMRFSDLGTCLSEIEFALRQQVKESK